VREAAVLIPLCTVNQQPAVLFTVRSKALSKHQGEVSFPGGMKDEEEMSLEDTMLREVEEEIHLPKSNVQVLGHLYDVPDRSRTIRVRPFIGFIGHFSDQDIKNMTFNTDEVSEIFTLTMNQITDAKLVSWDVMGNGLRVPIFHGSGKDDHRVWGLTAYILNIALQYIFFPKREYVRSQL
jgi:nudix motif 8